MPDICFVEHPTNVNKVANSEPKNIRLIKKEGFIPLSLDRLSIIEVLF